MGSFSQLGDCVCPPCLCQHHKEAYAATPVAQTENTFVIRWDEYVDGAVLVEVTITITERCCLCVNAAVMTIWFMSESAVEIERPLGTIRTAQEDSIRSEDLRLFHHAAWEVLNPGTYTYYLVNRAGEDLPLLAAWLKVIASDCEG